jgi:hypothetical protein
MPYKQARFAANEIAVLIQEPLKTLKLYKKL